MTFKLEKFIIDEKRSSLMAFLLEMIIVGDFIVEKFIAYAFPITRVHRR